MPGVGRVLPGRRGEPVPDRPGDPAPLPGRPAADGLHPHRPVPHASPRRPAASHAVRRHGQHAHDQPEPPLGSGPLRLPQNLTGATSCVTSCFLSAGVLRRDEGRELQRGGEVRQPGSQELTLPQRGAERRLDFLVLPLLAGRGTAKELFLSSSSPLPAPGSWISLSSIDPR